MCFFAIPGYPRRENLLKTEFEKPRLPLEPPFPAYDPTKERIPGEAEKQ
jgi:hypothetical protein